MIKLVALHRSWGSMSAQCLLVVSYHNHIPSNHIESPYSPCLLVNKVIENPLAQPINCQMMHRPCQPPDALSPFLEADPEPNIGMSKHFLLVGGISTPLKNMKVSWNDYSQYMEK